MPSSAGLGRGRGVAGGGGKVGVGWGTDPAQMTAGAGDGLSTVCPSSKATNSLRSSLPLPSSSLQHQVRSPQPSTPTMMNRLTRTPALVSFGRRPLATELNPSCKADCGPPLASCHSARSPKSGASILPSPTSRLRRRSSTCTLELLSLQASEVTPGSRLVTFELAAEQPMTLMTL